MRTLVFISLAAWPVGAGAQSWPQEPAGFDLVTDWGFDALVGGGWSNNGGSAQIVADADAPASPANVVRFTYPTGYAGGGNPDNLYHPLPTFSALYFGYWWRPSNPWQGHGSGINKIQFLMGDGHDLYVSMSGAAGGPYDLQWSLQFPGVSNGHLPGHGDDPGTWVLSGNVNRTAIALGQWHRIEAIVVPSSSTTARDGTLIWWLDGVIQGSYTNVNFPSTPFAEFQLAPTWGGVGEAKSQTDHYWYDHVRISLPGALRSSPPAPPTNLRVD